MSHRVLIADDLEASRKGLAALVATWGYEVEEAGDGEEALAKATDSNPAVVITDLVMPKLDGLGLLKARAGRAAVHHGHHPHRPRHHRDRGGGDQGRRLRLPDQAGGRGAAAPPRGKGHREGRGAARGQCAAPARQGGVGARPSGGNEQGHAGGVPPDRPRRRRPPRPSSSRARAVPARSWPRGRSTSCRRGARGRSSPSTARPSPRPCWRARSSVTSGAPSPARWSAASAASSSRIRARSSSMRSRR